MRNRSCKLNVAHTFTTNAGFCNFNAASIADYAFVTDLLVLTAMAFPVLARSENLFAVQTILLRL